MFHLFFQIKWTKKIEFKYFICFIYLRKNGKKCRGWHAGRFWDFTSANCRQVADDFCPTRELTQTLHFFPFSRKLFFIHPSYFTLIILQVPTDGSRLNISSDKVHYELFWRCFNCAAHLIPNDSMLKVISLMFLMLLWFCLCYVLVIQWKQMLLLDKIIYLAQYWRMLG